MHLSKAFDCINHNLLIAKLNAYRIEKVHLILFILTLPKEKCHVLTISKTKIDIYISDATVSNKKRVKLLGINLKSRFSFDFHVDKRIIKANKKCHALARLRNSKDSNKRRVLILSARIRTQTKDAFSYCQLAWSSIVGL